MLMMARGRARRTGVRRLRDTAGLGTSTRAGPTRGTWPGPLALSPVATVAVRTWRLMPRIFVTFFFAVSSLALRRPGPAVVRPVGAGPFHRRDAGSHGLGLRWTSDCLRPLGLRWLLGLGTLGRKSVPRCVWFHRVVHHLSFLAHCFRRGSGLAAISLCCSLGLRCPSFWQPILTH